MKKYENFSPQSASEKNYLDSDLHDRLMNITQLSAYNYFTGKREYALINTPIDDEKKFVSGVRAKEKQDFLENTTRNPELSYPKLEKFDAKGKEQELLALKEKIKDCDHPVVKKVYLWKINEKIAENRMLQAAQNGDDKKFTRYSVFINGAPEKKIFDYTLSSLLQKTEIALNTTDDVLIKAAAERLKNTFSHTENVYDQIQLKSGPHNTLDLTHIDEDFTLPQDVIERKNQENELTYSDEEIKSVFLEYLQELGMHHWEVVIEDTRTAISVGKNKIFIPKGRKVKEN